MFYFVPTLKTMTRQKADSLGLGYAAPEGDGGPTAVEILSGGPEGQAGIAFSYCDGSNLSRAGLVNWEEHYALPGVWLGVDPDRQTTPDDLERRDSLAGHPVRLADGQTWTVPVARMVNWPSVSM